MTSNYVIRTSDVSYRCGTAETKIHWRIQGKYVVKLDVGTYSRRRSHRLARLLGDYSVKTSTEVSPNLLTYKRSSYIPFHSRHSHSKAPDDRVRKWWCKCVTVFHCSDVQTVGLNPTWGTDVRRPYVCLYCSVHVEPSWSVDPPSRR